LQIAESKHFIYIADCSGGAENSESLTDNVDERQSQSSCVIDLSHNDVRNVERHAFAWIRHLDVVLGDGRLPMSVDAYAFYGARWMRRIVVQSVPALTLHPRIFTNTESVDRVEIKNTHMTKMDQFVFEGLKDVGGIVLDRVDVGNIHSYAFSGIHFRRHGLPVSDVKSGEMERQVNVSSAIYSSGSGEARKERRRARYAHSGSLLNVTSCHIGVLSIDAFRDANLAHILLLRSDVDRLQKHAFRGVSGLQSLSIVDCRLGSTIGAETFASLRGLRRLHLTGLVNTRVIDTFAFRGVTDIDEILINFRSDNVTLRTEAFARVSDVKTLELRGSQIKNTDSQSKSSTTALSIDVGAFRNLVGVESLRIVNFRLPTLRRYSFSGLSRIRNLTVSNCSVSGIEREAFGDVAGHVGAIGLLDLGVGNQLRCHCGTASGAAALQRELAQRFRDYRAVCRMESEDTEEVRYVDVRQMTTDLCSSSSSQRTVLSVSSILSLVTVAVALVELLAIYR